MPRDIPPDQLLAAYLALLMSAEDKLVVEEKKLQILKQLLAQVKVHPLQSVRPPMSSNWFSVVKKTSYFVLLVFGILEDLANSFYFGMALLALIPSVRPVVLLWSALAYALLDSIFFYVYESVLLQKALGIQNSPPRARRLIDTYAAQLKILTAINTELASMACLTIDNKRYAELLHCAQQATRAMRTEAKHLLWRDPLWKNVLNGVVFGFGAVSSAAGSYFLVSAFLTMLAPGLLGTPLGMALIVANVLIGMVFHYAMGSNSMARIISRDYPAFKTLKTNWALFNAQFADELSQLQTLKQRFEKKTSCERGTQTDTDNESLRFFSSPRGELNAETPSDSLDYCVIRLA